MRKAIFAIMTDTTLSEAEKAVKRQELMCGKWMQPKETTSHDSGSGEGERCYMNRSESGGGAARWLQLTV